MAQQLNLAEPVPPNEVAPRVSLYFKTVFKLESESEFV
jgi:hypothetical protein